MRGIVMGLYVITTLASWGIYYLVDKAYVNKLEREEYAFKDTSVYEKILDYAQKGLRRIIPVYNIYMAVKMLWYGDNYLEFRKREDLKNDKLIRVDSYEDRAQIAKENNQGTELVNIKEKTPEERIRELELERERLIKEYYPERSEEKSYQKHI